MKTSVCVVVCIYVKCVLGHLCNECCDHFINCPNEMNTTLYNISKCIILYWWEGLKGLIQENELEKDNHQGGAKHNGWHLLLLEDCNRADRDFMHVASCLSNMSWTRISKNMYDCGHIGCTSSIDIIQTVNLSSMSDEMLM